MRAVPGTATRTLALIRGLLLDLLADEDPGRVTAAVQAGTWQPALSARHRQDAQRDGPREDQGDVIVRVWA
jgi:hypothetical protein